MDYKFDNISIMNFIKILSTYRGLSLRKLIAKLSSEKNYSDCYPSFYTKLKNGTIKFSEIKDIADTLGYEIVFKDIRA
ncbi:hypothetical protein J6P92_02150 [bacterium]|nr:hypothetical protein [bacterium]